MELADDIVRYQYAERAKSELIVLSQMLMTLSDYRDAERAGAKRMLLSFMSSFRAEIDFSYRATSLPDFRRASELLSRAISMTESDAWGPAGLKLSEAISAVTTIAQGAIEKIGSYGTS
jgi:hypothetical protein